MYISIYGSFERSRFNGNKIDESKSISLAKSKQTAGLSSLGDS
jgi:hypothetical protein